MGAWGFFDDQNDSCADEWEHLMNKFLESIPKTHKKQLTSSRETIQYIRKHPKKWYNVLIMHIIHVIKNQAQGEYSDRVAVGLMLQTARTLSSKLRDVEENAAGFPSRLVQIRASFTGKAGSDFDLPIMPSDFPKVLCDFAHAVCCKYLTHEKNIEKEILQLERDFFSCK